MSFGLYGRRMIKSDETEVTVENVVAILNKALPYHWENRSEIQYLWYYYRGLQPILNREKQVRPEICNKIVENRANEIGIIFQKEDLENTTHTVEISAAVGDFEIDWFEVRGTIGDDTAGDPNNGDWPEETEPPTTEPKPTEPAKTDPPKTDPPKTSAPATSAPVTSAPAPSGNNGLSTGAIIGIVVAAVAVIAVVVIVVVKGKKK